MKNSFLSDFHPSFSHISEMIVSFYEKKERSCSILPVDEDQLINKRLLAAGVGGSRANDRADGYRR